MDKNKLEEAILSSRTKKEVINKLGLRSAGGNYSTFDKYVNLWKIDITHFDPNQKIRENLDNYRKEIELSLSELLKENCSYSRKSLKRRLYKEGLKKPICELCRQDENWNGKKMSLILDHINGVHNDNRLENLQIVCPNCNSTLDTFAGRNAKKPKKPKKEKQTRRKVERPAMDILLKEIEELGYSGVGRKYGVSDNAIRKWIK